MNRSEAYALQNSPAVEHVLHTPSRRTAIVRWSIALRVNRMAVVWDDDNSQGWAELSELQAIEIDGGQS